MAILTVLDTAPAVGSFRPAYSGNNKTIRFNESQLDYSKLANMSLVPGSPNLATVTRKFERPWIDHIPNWLGEYAHPTGNMSSYSREIGTDVGLGAIVLNSNYTQAQKRDVLIGMIQVGIDLFGIAQNGGEVNWINNGGHANGRKLPILIAGAVLGDTDMLGISATDRPTKIHFGEDDQTFYVTQDDVDRTHNWDLDVWNLNPDTRDAEWIPYEEEHIGLPEWNILHATSPGTSNRYWKTTYRECCTSSVWGGEALAALAMGLQGEWNHDAFFDYVDRYMDVQSSPIGTSGTQHRSTDDFIEAMWDEHRDDFGASWRRDDSSDLYSSGLRRIAGDFNGDGTVSAAVYTLWRDNFGTASPVGTYAEWVASFGNNEQGAVAVPEPASVLIALLGLGGLVEQRRQ